MRSRPLRTMLLSVVAVAMLAYGGSSLVQVWQMQRHVEGLEEESGRQRAQQQELSTGIHRFRTDPEAIEQAARELLGLVKPGDRVWTLPPSPLAPASAPRP
jgi:cell division protein FtsB